MKVIRFPKNDVFTKEGVNVFQNMVRYFRNWEKEGRIKKDELNTIVGGLYSIKVLTEKSATSQLKEWLKAKARIGYRELDDWSTHMDTLPPEDIGGQDD